VKRRYRVRENKRFQEIRRTGRSYTNELLVLCVLPNDLPYSRFGFSVSSRIGNAVTRNRIKRRLREAVRLRMDQIVKGWDAVFIARNPIRSADYHAMDAACARLLRRAHLLIDPAQAQDAADARPAIAATSKTSAKQDLVVESNIDANKMGDVTDKSHDASTASASTTSASIVSTPSGPAQSAQAALVDIQVDTKATCES
jgi:ribonuclease P protein component